jgi:hypothetical protein
MANKPPVALVQEKFGDKSKLVEALKALTTEELWLGRTSADAGGSRGLEHVSNAKLLRLHATFTEVKEKFGTRGKLLDEVVALEGRSKDAGFKKRLEAYPVPRLFDMYKSLSKRKKAAEKKASAKQA